MCVCTSTQCSTAVHEDEGRQDHAPYIISHGPPAAAGDAAPLSNPSSSPQSNAVEPRPGGDRDWRALPEVACATTQPATPISPILAHRAAVPYRKPPAQGLVVSGEPQSECVQCASKDSYVGGICQLCGHETEAAARAKVAPPLPPRQTATILGLLPTQRDRPAEQVEGASTPSCPTAGHVCAIIICIHACVCV